MGLVPHPVHVEYKQDADLLHLTFSNDESRTIYVPTLRGFCPCARCQGHGGGPHRWVPILDDICKTISNVAPVGTYALSIVWEDGHDTGIYTFKNLLAWPNSDIFTPNVTQTIQEGESVENVLNRL